MPLCNRVTPFGEIVAIPERGTMLGNRGVLHDEHRTIVRTSQVRRWICCVLQWKGIRRTIMRPRSYTELFFLDEATALAAGHRPCFECRRQAAKDYQAAWARALGGTPPMADAMDRVLAAERTLPGGGKRTYQADAARLPDGTFVAGDGAPCLVLGGRLVRWTPGGYCGSTGLRPGPIEVLTPRTTTAVLAAGYRPLVHPSA